MKERECWYGWYVMDENAEREEGGRREGETHLWGTWTVQCLVFCDTPHSSSCRGHPTHVPMSAQGVLSQIH